MKVLSSCLLAASLVLLAPPHAASAGAYDGDVVVARTGKTAILIWDAFRFLKDRAASAGTPADAERAIQVAALDELVAELPALKRSQTVRLVVLIRKPATGDNLIYQNTTFTDTTTLLTMEAPRAAAAAKHVAWSAALAAGRLPTGLTVAWENHLAH